MLQRPVTTGFFQLWESEPLRITMHVEESGLHRGCVLGRFRDEYLLDALFFETIHMF
jgi:hypothetical protein